jgi:hypothetical protein
MFVALSKKFGYPGAFAIGLLFVPIIFWPILGFSKNQYIGNAGPQQAYAEGQPPYNPNPVDPGQNYQNPNYQNPNPMG